jgi:hypothetical protein
MAASSRPSSWLLLASLAAGLACESSEQPRPFCTVRRDAYAARYDLVSGTGPCALLKGEVLGAQAYLPDPTKPGDRFSMAIQSEAVGKRILAGEKATPPVVPANPDHEIYAHGKFTSDRPDDSNLCSVPELTEAQLVLAEVPSVAGAVALPPIDVRYQWSNVSSYVTTASTGLLWAGELTYSLDGCTARYSVMALAPKVACDRDGKPDARLCGGPDPATGFLGSGLNPDIAVRCDPDLLLCVPDRPFPSLK